MQLGGTVPAAPTAHQGFQEGRGKAPAPDILGWEWRKASTSPDDKVIPSGFKPAYLPLVLRCCRAVIGSYHQGPVIRGHGRRVRANGVARGPAEAGSNHPVLCPLPTSSPWGAGESITFSCGLLLGAAGKAVVMGFWTLHYRNQIYHQSELSPPRPGCQGREATEMHKCTNA